MLAGDLDAVGAKLAPLADQLPARRSRSCRHGVEWGLSEAIRYGKSTSRA
jgi:hypothetical protein